MNDNDCEICHEHPATVVAIDGRLCAECDADVQKLTDVLSAGGKASIHVESTGQTFSFWFDPEVKP